MLKNASTYEIMTPESVGADSSGMLVLGKHSGKAAYKARLVELGYDDVANDEEMLNKVVQGAKAVADQKKVLSDEDLEALLGASLYHGDHDTWELESLQIQSSSQGMRVTATATVALRDVETGEETMQAAIGIGPVDAAFKAILTIVDRPIKLTNYNINKISGGMQSAGNESLASVALHIREAGAIASIASTDPQQNASQPSLASRQAPRSVCAAGGRPPSRRRAARRGDQGLPRPPGPHRRQARLRAQRAHHHLLRQQRLDRHCLRVGPRLPQRHQQDDIRGLAPERRPLRRRVPNGERSCVPEARNPGPQGPLLAPLSRWRLLSA